MVGRERGEDERNGEECRGWGEGKCGPWSDRVDGSPSSWNWCFRVPSCPRARGPSKYSLLGLIYPFEEKRSLLASGLSDFWPQKPWMAPGSGMRIPTACCLLWIWCARAFCSFGISLPEMGHYGGVGWGVEDIAHELGSESSGWLSVDNYLTGHRGLENTLPNSESLIILCPIGTFLNLSCKFKSLEIFFSLLNAFYLFVYLWY